MKKAHPPKAQPTDADTFMKFMPLLFLLGGVFEFTWQMMQRLASAPKLNTIRIDILYANDLLDGGPIHLPHIGFFQAAAAFHKVFGISIENASILTLSLAMTLAALAIFVILSRQLQTTSMATILSFTAILMIVGPIYLPFFNKSVYFGQGSPNMWHNATVITVKFIALASFYLTLEFLETSRFRRTLLIGAMLATLLSAHIKPTFVLAFLPALGIYLVWRYPMSWNLYGRLFFVALPTLALLFWQQRFFPDTGRTLSIGFLTVWRMFTPNVFVSILLALAFPLSVLAPNFRELRTNGPLLVAWIMTLIGIGYFALILPLGPFGIVIKSGNWIGPYLMALSMLFVTSIVEFLKNLNQAGASRRTGRFKVSVQTLLLALHVYGGVFYLFELYRNFKTTLVNYS